MRIYDLRIKNTAARLVLATAAGTLAGIASYVILIVFASLFQSLAMAEWIFLVAFFSIFVAASLCGAWSFWRLTPGDHGAHRGVVMRRIWARRTGAAARAGTVIALLSFPLFLVTLPFLLEWISWEILGCQELIRYCVLRFGIAEDVTIAFLIAFIVILSYLASRLLYACMIFQRVLDETPRCDCCGYNLTGNRSGRCPECGTPFDEKLLKKNA